MKKLLSLILTVLICVTTIGTNKVFAASADLNVERTNQGEYFVNNTNNGIYGNQWWWGLATLGGEVAYCIDPVAHTNDGAIYKSTNFFNTLPNSQQQQMWRIAYFGYGFEGDKNINRYLAAQELIWEQMTMEQLYDYGDPIKFDIDYVRVMGTANLNKINEYKNTIKSLISTYNMKPSFNNQTIDVKVGETVTLTDTNKVLERYNITLPSGMQLVSKSGNTLKVKITSSDVNGQSIRFSKKYQPSQKSTLVWERGVDQRLMTFGIDRFDPANGVINFTISNGNLSIQKNDENGSAVQGAKFEISYNANMSSPIGTYTTNATGNILIQDLEDGTIYVREVETPSNLVLDNSIYPVTVVGGETVTYNAVNYFKRGDLKISKQDDEGNYIPGVQFQLSYNSNMSSPIGTYTTGSDGTVTVPSLLAKKVYVKEVSVPEHLILDSSIKAVDVAYNTTTSFKATNAIKRGYIQVVKKDADTDKVVKVEGAKFGIYDADDNLIETITTNAEGIAKTSALNYGTYYVSETLAPENYTKQDSVSADIGVIENGKTYEVVIKNKRVAASLEITKEDDTTITAQGEGTLANAVYGLYAREDILDPSNKENVLYKAGTLIDELVINSEGKASIDNLYLGKYYLKELVPPYGYNLDLTQYNIDFLYTNQNTVNIAKEQTVKERVISQAFSIIKISSSDGNDEVAKLEGAEFTVKAQKDIDKYGSWEKAPIAKNADGEETKILVTDKNGYAESDRLPFGSYVVRETKVPDEMMPVEDFTVEITQDSATPQAWKILDDKEFRSILAVVKQDAETHQTVLVPGATFKIKNTDSGEYFGYWNWNPLPHYVDSWTTDKSGTFMTGDILEPGNYQLEEVAAPHGYVLSKEPIPFKITKNAAHQTLPDGDTPVITVIKENNPVYGKIRVYKEGEVVTGFDKGQFVYEKRPLSDTTFEIYAKEDIYKADNQGILVYAKDALVDTITTNAAGNAITKELPLGSYYVKEKSVTNGFVKNEEIKDVTLSYKDQISPIVYTATSYFNNRQTVDLSTVKKDAETKEFVGGAEFTIYANQTIYAYNGDVILNKGDAIETVTTSKDGTVKFTTDFPVGAVYYESESNQFVIRETKAPIGYASTSNVVDVTIVYQDQTTPVIELETEISNKPITVEVSKQDITTDVETEGNVLQIFDSKGKKVDEWTSVQDKAHVVKYLHIGETYTLVEYLAREGYLKAPDVKFTVTDTEEIQKVTMKDERVYGQISVSKVGQVLIGTETLEDGTVKFIYEEQPLADAVFEIYADKDIKHPDGVSEDFYKAGQLVATVTTDKNGTAKTGKLPLGDYSVIEKSAPNGFVLNSTPQRVSLVYENQSVALVFDDTSFTNERQKVEVTVKKQDSEQDVYLAGAEFTLYAKQDILSIDGAVVVKAGEKIESVVTDETGTAKFTCDLPLSVYKIKETKAPIGYASTEETIEVYASYQGQTVTLISTESGFKNDITKVQISKIDITTKQELPGSQLMLFEKDNEGAIFDTWVSTTEPHLIIGLEVGKTYLLRETSSSYGFSIAPDVEFTVLDTGEVQEVVIENDLTLGKLSWVKTGEIVMDTKEEETEFGKAIVPVWKKSNLLGAEITIYAAENITLANGITYYFEDQEIETLESDWEAVLSKNLPVGKYYYLETKTPLGKIPDKEKHFFEVLDNQSNEVQIVESELDNKRPTYELNFTKKMQFGDTYVNQNAWKDVVFGLYTLDDTYNYMGEVILPADTLIGVSNIDEEGHLVNKFDLPVGNYYLKELKTNLGYKLNENQYPFSIDQSSEEVVVVDVNNGVPILNEVGEYFVLINKVDSNTGKNIISKEFEFTAYRDEACTEALETLSADTADGTVKFVVEYGFTYIKETKAPEGYGISDEVVVVEVNENGLFINGKKIEESKDLLHSIEFPNSLLPIIRTGIDANITSDIVLLAVSVVGIIATIIAAVVLKRKKNK